MKTVSVLLLLFGAAPRGEVIELTGNNCIHCQNMVPIVHRLQKEGLPIRQVDVDRQPEEARRYAYDGLPTFLVVSDGKVISRTLGAVSEAELRRLVSKIPVVAETVSPRPSSSSPNLRVELGEPAALPRPAAGQGVVAEVTPPPAAEETDSLSFPRLFRRSPKAEPAVRGQSQSPVASAEGNGEASLAASVKLNLHSPKGILQGSGTIIDSRPGRTLVITAGAPFSQLPAGSKIEVEVPSAGVEGRPRQFVAKLLKADMDADVALIEFPTDEPLPRAAIAPAARAPQLSDRVACIGGASGAPITRDPARVTALNKYVGPDTIECSGVPLPGRCGGGLFNAQDELIGVCIAVSEDPKTKAPIGGMYCGLKPIHELLRSQNLAALFEKPAPIPQESQPQSLELLAETELGTPRPMPATVRPAVNNQAPIALAMDSGAGAPAIAASGESQAPVSIDDDHEVIVIIRPKKSTAPARVIHIHKASPKLRALLDGPQASIARETPALTGVDADMRTTTTNNRRLSPPPLAVN